MLAPRINTNDVIFQRALYAKAFNCFKKKNCGKESNFSVNSEAIKGTESLQKNNEYYMVGLREGLEKMI